MDVQSLRWFQQVADGLTVTEVSELDMVSQPGISRALGRLESAVGTPLLRREGRLLRMTHAGAAFKQHLDAALHHLDNAVAAAQQSLDPLTGIVTITHDPTLGLDLISQTLASFHAAYPGVQLDLHTTAHPDTDFTITATIPEGPWHRLGTEVVRLLVPLEHRLARARQVDLGQAAGERFIVTPEGTSLRSHTLWLCSQAGFEPEAALTAPDLATLHSWVAAGLGLGLSPAGLACCGVKELPLSGPAARREVLLSWAPQARLLPSAQLFLAHIRAEQR